MSTVNTGEIYTIRGQTLQDLLSAVNQLKNTTGVSVGNLPSWMANIDGRDWNYELNGNFPVTIHEPRYISDGVETMAYELPQIDSTWWGKVDGELNRIFFFGDSNVLLDQLTNEFECNRSLQYAYITSLNGNTNLNGMFQGCTSLHDVYIPNSEMSNVISISNMFAGCISLTYPPDLDVSSVQQARYTFAGCYGLYNDTAMNQILKMCSEMDCTSTLNVVLGEIPQDSHITWITNHVPSLSNYADFIAAGWRIR